MNTYSTYLLAPQNKRFAFGKSTNALLYTEVHQFNLQYETNMK